MKARAKQNLTAVIYDRKGRVLSIGQNSYIKTHPLQAKHANKVGLPDKHYLHAEVHAIVKCKDLSKAHKIFISRFGKEGQPLWQSLALFAKVQSRPLELSMWNTLDFLNERTYNVSYEH